MALPLYREARTYLATLEQLIKDRKEINYALYFDRFFSAYLDDYGLDQDETRKTEWLSQFHNKKIGVPIEASLKERAISLRLLAVAQKGKAGIFKVDSQMVTGTGLPHPVENGFLWHPILGMPYLPGSIVKGIVRSLIETSYALDDEPKRKEVLLRWFGSEDKNVSQNTNSVQTSDDMQAGNLIFLDALPIKSCQLYQEIMTPHMGKWYEQGAEGKTSGDALPGDWHAPVPISYLVARDLSLQFIILPRITHGSDNVKAAADVQNAWEALNHALDWLGAGAKTAIGFGRMIKDEKEENKLHSEIEQITSSQQQQAHLASLSEIAKQIAELEILIESNPTTITANDMQNTNTLNNIAGVLETVLSEGNADDKALLLGVIVKGEKSGKIKISKKREKDFKLWKRQLSE